jgi:hypothetical protein
LLAFQKRIKRIKRIKPSLRQIQKSHFQQLIIIFNGSTVNYSRFMVATINLREEARHAYVSLGWRINDWVSAIG